MTLIKNNKDVEDNKQCKYGQKFGLHNWLIILVSILSAFMVVDNYIRFTTINGPIEIASLIVNEILQHSGLFYITTICYFLQIAQTFFLEKLLALDLVSETVGMVVHAANVFFLPTVFIILARTTNANPVIARFVITYIMYVMTKVWSYAFVNMTYRKAYQQKKKTTEIEGEKCLIQYPSNVTWRNIIEYMIFTPPVQYQASYPNRTSPDWKMFLKLCCQLFFVYYMTSLLLLQFIVPELSALGNGYGDNLHLIKGTLKIALCTNLLWLLCIYIHVYRVYLPAYAALTGMKDVTFSKDWWNSETVTVFWRKWNLPVHLCLKHNVALPLIRSGYSTTLATAVCFIIAGILHEYLNTLPCGIYNGTGFLCTLLEMPAGYVSDYVARHFGNRCGNLFLWIYLMSTHLLAMMHLSSHLSHMNIL